MNRKNPFIEPYDYREGYHDSIDKLKDRPELLEFGQLCYEVFEQNDKGKRLMELIVEKYLLPSLVQMNNPKFETACIWENGFKEAYRHLKKCALTHEQYIKSETNKE